MLQKKNNYHVFVLITLFNSWFIEVLISQELDTSIKTRINAIKKSRYLESDFNWELVEYYCFNNFITSTLLFLFSAFTIYIPLFKSLIGN